MSWARGMRRDQPYLRVWKLRSGEAWCRGRGSNRSASRRRSRLSEARPGHARSASGGNAGGGDRTG